MSPADEHEVHFEQAMFDEESQFWEELVRDTLRPPFEFDDEDFLE